MKLYFIDGIRHCAVVMANSRKEAVELATRAREEGINSDNLLFGSVGEWECPTAHELKLPKGYRITEERKVR